MEAIPRFERKTWRLLALCGTSVLLLANGNPAEAIAKGLRGVLGKVSIGQHDFGQKPLDGEENFEINGGTRGDFNLYIFAMSWKPEWCYHSTFPGCQAPRLFWEDNLTIHGLWPDYGDGTYPTHCTSEAYDHDRVVAAIGLETLETVWPNIQVPEDAGTEYDSFWEHEWTKHGTCTGLSQEDYFTIAVATLQQRYPTPPALTQNVGGETSRSELENAYGGAGMAVLDCRGNVYINQVFLCFDIDESGGPGDLVSCPAAVVAHDDKCGQSIIKVPSF
ncbi:unnamed protein product [Ascophyllum nodosum]